MNLYTLHSDPQSLKHHDYHMEKDDQLFLDTYSNGGGGYAFIDPYAGRYSRPDQAEQLKKIKHVLAKSAEKSLYYAHKVTNTRFKEGEKAIAASPTMSLVYARNVLKGRFPEGEKAIATDPLISYQYAEFVLQGRFPEGEKEIATSPQYACDYAIEVLKGRFPEGEKAIATSPKYAYLYARFALQDKRFPVGEMEIASNGHYAFLYAQNIIKGKWPEGEKAIMSDPELAHSYTQFLLYDKHFLMGEKP